ncbi:MULTISPECIES: GGDEF domain-containing protein [Polyangium]|uniref:diguanylate cyclase n=2 Tax=Polyangium TaxID=55 RepID=A0ABT6NMF9_9BACT|nr:MULTISPECIES: GGDEF domain-containing protein [Polyangium]MDC0746809.1 GGDEF domain-containing protein [Polyangium mundeleinium]MDI1429448.1 GGDEF domain-containing protein [Polyangium sorediatum]MDI3284358.1 GGDEF domain-containing protein [Polyangium sp. 15x6]
MNSGPPDDDIEATRVAHVKELQDELRARSQRDRAYLIVLVGSNVGEMFEVEFPETVLGRGANATVRLNDDGISRRHARLVRAGNDVVLEDLNSSNGTSVNGENISQRILRDGDKIRLGSTTILKFTYHDHLDVSFQQQMIDAALRDGLTKAFNKRYFLSRLETEIAYAKRHRAPLSLVMFDVDHFKRVNDTYGHLAGDYVLTKISKLTMNTVRTEDVFARYGGEEFGVICRGVSLGNAGILGERLRSAVETASFEHEGTRIPITISVGVAASPDLPVETPEQLIAAADEALYQAKRTGRNRVLLKHGTG